MEEFNSISRPIDTVGPFLRAELMAVPFDLAIVRYFKRGWRTGGREKGGG